MELNRFNMRKLLKLAIIIVVITFLLMHITDLWLGVKKLTVLLTPFIIGVGAAFVWNVPLRFIEQRFFDKIQNERFKKLKRPLAIFVSFFILVFILSLGALIIVPQLVESISLFVNNIPQYIESVEGFAERLPDPDGRIHDMLSELRTMSPMAIQENLLDFLGKGALLDQDTIADAITSTFGVVATIVGIIINIFIGIFFAIYALAKKEVLLRQCRKIIYAFLNDRHAAYTIHVAQVFFSKTYRFVTGQATEAVILGTLTFLGMWIFRFPYAAMIGVLTGFSALVPIVGAIVGGAVGVLLILPVDPMKAVLFLVFIVVLQQFESNVIYPRVVGGSVGLPAIWTLVAITIGGTLMGLIGMLIFVPFASACYHLLGEIVYGRLHEKRITDDSPEIVTGLPRGMEHADTTLEVDMDREKLSQIIDIDDSEKK